MSNSIATMQVIAREALSVLKDYLAVPALMSLGYTKDFVKGVGSTVKARIPASFTAVEFTSTTSAQAVTETTRDIAVNHHADVSFELGSLEKALSLEDLNKQVIEPAVAALAAKMNHDAIDDIYGDIPNYCGTAGTLPSDVTTIIAARTALNTNRAPQEDRSCLLGPALEAKLLSLDTFKNASASGDTEALRNASLGRVFGFGMFSGNEEFSHTVGGYTGASTPVATGTAGASTVALSAASGTGKLLRGDLLTVGGVQYVVTADSADASSNAIASVAIYPALAATLSSAAVTFVTATHKNNLAFHRSGIAFVNPALEKPEGGVESYVVSVDGLSIRVVKGYSMSTKKELFSLDSVYGFKVLDGRRCCRILN